MKWTQVRALLADGVSERGIGGRHEDPILLARPPRYERGSIGTFNPGFAQWSEILGDAMVAAALIDRLVHYATIITLKGQRYRPRDTSENIRRCPRPTIRAPATLFPR